LVGRVVAAVVDGELRLDLLSPALA
jgi:hypothetical protein